jgi:hypothetical protein
VRLSMGSGPVERAATSSAFGMVTGARSTGNTRAESDSDGSLGSC